LSHAFVLALLVDRQLGWKQNATEVEKMDSGNRIGVFVWRAKVRQGCSVIMLGFGDKRVTKSKGGGAYWSF
jgi:hypothetical protein